MQVIPVIDLLNNQVVHAQQGKRATYQPIKSPLVSSADPNAVIDAMLGYYPFKTIYIADLNSIRQKGIESQHYALIETLCKRYSEVTFWVDAGTAKPKEISQWYALPIQAIVSSENFSNVKAFAQVMNSPQQPSIISLDFLNDRFLGDPLILENTELWPDNVITMTLDNVGASNGPNWDKLQQIKTMNKQANLIAAGGVRDINDLRQLKQMDVDAVLIATALHHKRISAKEITNLNK